MRVLLVHHAWPPYGIGGSELYTEGLARALARDHEVTVLHRSIDAARPDYEVRESRRDGVRVLALNNLLREGGGFEAYRDRRVTAVAAAVLSETRPDVVHVGHLAGLSTGIVFEARRHGAAVVMTLHDFSTLCPLGQLVDSKLRVCPGPSPRRCSRCVGSQVAVASPAARSLGRRLPLAGAAGHALSVFTGAGRARIAEREDEMREVLRAADVLVSPSRFLKERMQALGVAGIEHLPNGHAPLAVPPRRPDRSGRVRFGFIGSAIPSKGVHVLAEAFRRLDDPRAALRIHGPFVPYHGDVGYEQRVRRILGPHAGECLAGAFAPERLGDVLAGLDVLVVPSVWEENAPLTVQEAFLARRPLVVSDHGGLAEAVREGVDGLRFRPGDAADLARAMRRLLDDVALRERLGSRPPPVPSLEDHAEALTALYATAVHRRRQRQGRVGVVVLDNGRPQEAAEAARSAWDEAVRPRILVVENGPGGDPVLPAGGELLRLPRNVGYAAGMNAGIARLRRLGCDRFLLLNNDARLDPGCLLRLAEALDGAEPGWAAAGPVVRRESDGRIESRGVRFDPRSGRHRLAAHGEEFRPGEARVAVASLSGAAWMVTAAALDRVGTLDEAYFHSFEDTDWCLRARAAGLSLALVRGAVARHGGSRTLGPSSPTRLYYAARNHLRAAERLGELTGPARGLRRAVIVALNLAHALRQRQVPRWAGVSAVLRGVADFHRGVFGPASGRR